MDLAWVVALVFAALLTGAATGYAVGYQRAPRDRQVVGAIRSAATIRVIDSLVADGIRSLRGWLVGRDGEAGLTLASDGTISLLFSDIEGSTALNHRLGDERFAELLREHDAVVAEQVRRHDGRVVKTQGDGFLAAFHETGQAVACALRLAEVLADHPRVGEPLRLRLGVHVGSAVTTDDDVFGATVAFAARVAGAAAGGEVLASADVQERLADRDDVAFAGRLFRSRLKGVPGRHRLYAVTATD